MILGSSMESLSRSGQAGTGIPACTLPDPELRLDWVLALVSLAGLAGAGTTGDLTGITTVSFSTTTATYPTAESSSTATTSIAPADFGAVPDFTAAALVSMAPQRRSTDSRHHMPSLVSIPARLAALIMEELREASPLAGSRASVEVSTEAEVFTVGAAFTVAEVAGNSIPLLRKQLTTWRMKSCAIQI